MTTPIVREVETQTESAPTDLCRDWIFDPMARRTVHINPTFRNKKRREEFDPIKFLTEKKGNQEYHVLEFQSDEEMEDELAILQSSSDKKRLNRLADGVLRKMAEHLENLNRVYNYRLLDVHYEKGSCEKE